MNTTATIQKTNHAITFQVEDLSKPTEILVTVK